MKKPSRSGSVTRYGDDVVLYIEGFGSVHLCAGTARKYSDALRFFARDVVQENTAGAPPIKINDTNY